MYISINYVSITFIYFNQIPFQRHTDRHTDIQTDTRTYRHTRPSADVTALQRNATQQAATVDDSSHLKDSEFIFIILKA